MYLVATPIGNLSDISERAIETLKSVDFIAAEDTRVSRKLLTHFGIKKPLVSYHEFNRFDAGNKILTRLKKGESCALVTDAGTPGVSDPGVDLVRLCSDADIPVVSLPGPCAVICALSLSGLDTSRFVFEGFLPADKKKRLFALNDIKQEKRTIVFYEAPHKLKRTLADMLSVFGDRSVSVSREITKLYEQTLRMTLSDMVEYFDRNAPRGEFVLVVEGAKDIAACENAQSALFESAVKSAKKLIEDGMSVRDASRKAALDTGCSRNDLYKTLISTG